MGLWLPAHLEAPKLKEEVTRLEKVLASRDRQIAELQSLLVPFKTVAFQNFTGTEAERLSQLALKLNDVQKGLETLSNDQSAMKAKAEQINIYASEARQKAAELESLVEKAADAQRKLGQATEFTMLLARASNDDRTAFDKLMAMAFDERNPEAELAKSAIIKIATDITNVLHFDSDTTKQGLAPKTASIAEFKVFIQDAKRPDFAVAVVNKLMEQDRFRKRDRLQVLVDTISDTKSVAVLSAACQALNAEAKIDKNIIGWPQYIQWWEMVQFRYL